MFQERVQFQDGYATESSGFLNSVSERLCRGTVTSDGIIIAGNIIIVKNKCSFFRITLKTTVHKVAIETWVSDTEYYLSPIFDLWHLDGFLVYGIDIPEILRRFSNR